MLLHLQSKLQNDGIFSGGRTSLRRVLKGMGFKHKTINDKRLALHQFIKFKLLNTVNVVKRRLRKYPKY